MNNYEIIENYMPPFPNDKTRPSTVVRSGVWFLRYSIGPRTGTFWDTCGDDFLDADLAKSEADKAPEVPKGSPYMEFRIPLTPKLGEEEEGC